jgi:phospholipid/cholesterol/gamma-HCH transport system substrate-binding protein
MTATASAPKRRNGLFRLRDFITRRPGLLRNILVFLFTIVLGLVIFAVFVSQEDIIFPWQHKVSYYAVFNDASAVAPGQHQEIRVAGVHVGDIGTATLNPGGKAKVQLLVTQKNLTLYDNASAILQAKTPLNEMYLELNPGTPGHKVMKSGGTIPLSQTTSPVEVDQILQHLGPEQQNAIKVLLSETNTGLSNASDYLPSDLSAANSTVTNLQPVAAALATRQANIRTLVSDLNQIANVAGGNQSRLGSILATARTTLSTLAQNDGSLSQTLQDLPQTTNALGQALPKVQALAGQLNPLLDHVRAASTILPNALDQLNTTLKVLHPVVNQLGPVITDATPLVSNLSGYLVTANPTLAVLNTIVPDLKPLTAYLSYDMPWLQGFFYNTNSVTSVDSNPAGKNPVFRSLVVSGGGSTTGLCDLLGGVLNLPSTLSTTCGALTNLTASPNGGK